MRVYLLWFLLAVSVCSKALWAFTNDVGAMHGCGGVSSNTSHRSVGRLTSLSAEGLGESGSHWVRVGMLASFLLNPNLDLDGDGIPDEDDWDDDGDGLRDVDELAGAAFSPASPSNPLDADSDGDGASDGQEAAAGTNPGDRNVGFRITNLEQRPGAMVVTWRGREGFSYDLAVAETPHFVGTAIVTNIVASGGTGTWFEVEINATNVTSETRLFYRVSIHE